MCMRIKMCQHLREYKRKYMKCTFSVYFYCIHTCLGGLNGLPVTRAFGSKERGESGVLPVRDLNTLVAGRPLTNLQQRSNTTC